MVRKVVAVAAALAACVVLAAGATAAQNVAPIVAEGIVEAPVDDVWAAWATGAGLRSWLAPHADIDLRLGGLMRTNYNAQGRLGDAGTIENVVLSFDPGRMLSIRIAKAPAGFPFPNVAADMWTVIYFEPVDTARTWLRVVGHGFSPGEESQKMRAFFERGNVTTIEQLQKRFAKAAR